MSMTEEPSRCRDEEHKWDLSGVQHLFSQVFSSPSPHCIFTFLSILAFFCSLLPYHKLGMFCWGFGRDWYSTCIWWGLIDIAGRIVRKVSPGQLAMLITHHNWLLTFPSCYITGMLRKARSLKHRRIIYSANWSQTATNQSLTVPASTLALWQHCALALWQHRWSHILWDSSDCLQLICTACQSLYYTMIYKEEEKYIQIRGGHWNIRKICI